MSDESTKGTLEHSGSHDIICGHKDNLAHSWHIIIIIIILYKLPEHFLPYKQADK